MKNVSDFANRVRQFRRARKLTQEELAEKLGVTRNYLSMIEGGREPSETVQKLFGNLENVAATGGLKPELKEGALEYRISGGGIAGGEGEGLNVREGLSEGARSALDHFVEKMDNDQVADEVCTILKKKKAPTRFETARYLIAVLEERSRRSVNVMLALVMTAAL